MNYKFEIRRTPNADLGGNQLTQVTMNLTDGELVSLQHALFKHDTTVGHDLKCLFISALQRAGITLP